MSPATKRALANLEPVKIDTGMRFRPCCPDSLFCDLGDLVGRHGDVLARDITRKEAQELALAYIK